jgi:uncharacterized membrane protein
MWYFPGMAVCLFLLTLLPFIRFRNYFNQVLKEPDIKKVPTFTLLWNHILISIFEFNVSYNKYRENVLQYREVDTEEILLAVLFLILLIVIWVVTLPAWCVLYLWTLVISLVERRVKQKIENAQNE